MRKKIISAVIACCLVIQGGFAAIPAMAEEIDEEDVGEEDITEPLINYLVVDRPYVEPGETQSVVVSVGDGDTEVTSALLTWHRQSDGTVYETEASVTDGGVLLFEIFYPEDSDAAVYILDTVSYVADDVSCEAGLSEIGIDARYGVAVEVDTDPDAFIEDEVSEDEEYALETGVVTFDEDGNQTSENSIGEAITEQQAQIPSTMAASGSSSGDIVVVLDPGHDSTHTGAGSSNGLREETLNLKIAQYCKAELETYDGVQVYMTRETEACPFPGSSSSTDLEKRVNYAASVGATVYVSLHLNAYDDSGSSSVHGAEIYYPNRNYNSSVSREGEALADEILAQLEALGITGRFTTTRNSTDSTYADGSTRDYYAIIWRSKAAGFPGIIVEHAYLTNSSDVKNYLSTEDQLKALGVADATGIANYYGLSSSGRTAGSVAASTVSSSGPDIVKIDGTWTYTVDGEPDYTYTGLAKNSNGWYYIKDGVLDRSYTGFATNENGSWYITDGKLTRKDNTVIKDTKGVLGGTEEWYYVVGSKVQYDFTGLANYKNASGWWYITDGRVDRTANTVAKNKNGWWYVLNGKVQKGFTGLADYKNASGWWYITNGKVDRTANTVAKNKNGWYYVLNGKVQKSFTGLANYRNSSGWWYITGGRVDRTFNGIAQNKNGWYYIKNGKVQQSFTGTVTINGTSYSVKNGKVAI